MTHVATAEADDIDELPPYPLKVRAPSEPIKFGTLEDVFTKAQLYRMAYREKNRAALNAKDAAYRAQNADVIRAKRTADRARKKAEQLAAREKRQEELKAALRDPRSAVMLGVMPR